MSAYLRICVLPEARPWLAEGVPFDLVAAFQLFVTEVRADVEWLRSKRPRHYFRKGSWELEQARRCVERWVDELLEAGCSLRVFCGDRQTVALTTDRQAILVGLQTAARDTIVAYRSNKEHPIFYLQFIYTEFLPEITFIRMPAPKGGLPEGTSLR